MNTMLGWLHNMKICNSKAQLPNGTCSVVKNIGDLSIGSDKKLTRVLHLLDFSYNLLSVAKFTKIRCYAGPLQLQSNGDW